MPIIVKKEIGKPIEIVEINEIYRGRCAKKALGLAERDWVEFVPLNQDFTLSIGVDEEGLQKSLLTNFLIPTNNPHFPIQKMVGTVVFSRVKKVEVQGEIYDYEIEDIRQEDIGIIEKLLCEEYQEQLRKKFNDYGRGYMVCDIIK